MAEDEAVKNKSLDSRYGDILELERGTTTIDAYCTNGLKRQDLVCSESQNFLSKSDSLTTDQNCVSAIRQTYFYGMIHGFTDQMFPSCFKVLETDVGLGPQAMGGAIGIYKMAHVITCPVWGYLVDCCGRRRIFFLTALLWGLSTAALLFATKKWHIISLMAIAGVFLAAMGPLSQKVLGQEIPQAERGSGFGILHFFQSCGRIMCISILVPIAALHFHGIAGWRLGFLVWGILCCFFGFIFLCCMKDCEIQRQHNEKNGRIVRPREVKYVFRNGSIWIMILMGFFNGITRSSLSFSLLFFQYCGINDNNATVIVASSWVAAMLVAPVVGYLVDYVHSLYPTYGRPAIAQAALAMRSVLMMVMLVCVPQKKESLWLFLILAILIGLLAGWPGVGVNRPILTEIVKPHHRASIFALVSTSEACGAALLGAPVVGVLSEKLFGYITIPHGLKSLHLPASISSTNAHAISRALLCMTVGPWLINIMAYGVLHLTYKYDKHHGAQSKGVTSAGQSDETAQLI